MKERLYSVKSGANWQKCPLCGAKLAGCNLGEYCSNKKCPYVDGIAWLTEKQAEKFKDKLDNY